MNAEIEMNEITERSNLAVVGRIERLEPIPNKDNIELCFIADCGYTFVVQKGHEVNSLVVYVKYDSIVPDNELFGFMRETKFRVKAKSFTERDEDDVVIKKIYSQGIVLPLAKMMEFTAKRDCSDGLVPDISMAIDKEFQNALWNEGDDLTEFLGVKKYIPPVSNGGGGLGVMASKGDFPTQFVSKTDETNLASKTKALEEIQGKAVYITQKIEGSSLTVMWDEERDELMVCSRNNQIGYHETNKFWQALNITQDIGGYLFNNKWMILQAECYGPGIQKNKLGVDRPMYAVFNVVDKRHRRLLSYNEAGILLKSLGIPMVPEVMFIPEFNMTFDELQELADVQRYANGELAEGIVIRPCEPFVSRYTKEDWSFKCISREYKL